MTAASNEAAGQSILAHEAGSGVAINTFGGRGGSCFGCGSYYHQVAACPSPVPTSIATVTNLEAEAGREGAEAVADEEEDVEEK
jgi:Na+-transporting NADH:ubiquinone oxidoreductase subunit NqrF